MKKRLMVRFILFLIVLGLVTVLSKVNPSIFGSQRIPIAPERGFETRRGLLSSILPNSHFLQFLYCRKWIRSTISSLFPDNEAFRFPKLDKFAVLHVRGKGGCLVAPICS